MPPCPAPNVCWLYLIRHGATANNRARPPRLQGRRTDPELSDEGLAQAQATAELLSADPFDAVYASPLLRAMQTARAIAAPHGLSVEPIDDLMEVDVGIWEGQPWNLVEREHAEAYRLFMEDASVHPYLGGENMQTVHDRVVPAITKLLADNLGRRIAAIAHNCVNRSYLTHLLNTPLKNYRSIPQDNCGVNLIRYRDGNVRLVTVNAVGHLGEEG